MADAGYSTYLVGGVIRDQLLNRSKPPDYDLATAAPLSVIRTLFDTRELGRRFGTIAILTNGHRIDIARLRTETGYSNHRHPDTVTFTDSIELDLQRRDFTVNAMAWNPLTQTLIDPFQGLNDLNAGILRMVGDAHKRFSVDSLRIFRAYRFVAQLGFRLASDVGFKLSYPLPSSERITHELNSLIHGSHAPTALALMAQHGWLSRLFFPQGDTHAWPDWSALANQPTEFKWAWVLQTLPEPQWDWLTLPKKTKRWIRHVIAHDFHWERCHMTPADLALSSQDLMTRGFSGQGLANLQTQLMDYIAHNTDKNTPDGLDAFIQKTQNEASQ